MFFLGERVDESSDVRSSPTTVADWLGNPPGSNTRHVGARYSIVDSLKDRFYKDILNNQEKFRQLNIFIFKTQQERVYDVIVKIPSSTVKNMAYDVLLRLWYPDDVKLTKNAYVTIYTNSPSWVFTYAYICNKYKVMHPFGPSLLSSTILNTPPKKVNPDEQFGFDKIVTFALIFLTLPTSPTHRYDGVRALSSSSKLSQKEITSLKFDSVFEKRQHEALVQSASILKEKQKKRADEKKRELEVKNKLDDMFKKNRGKKLFDAKGLFDMNKRKK